MPTTDRNLPNPDPESAAQIAYLAENAKFFDLEYFNEFDKRQGIVHIIGPEQGFTLPGITLVCGDSHTATHGAFGALAYGIGTSEVEHVLATQTLIQSKSKNMRAVVDGKLPAGVTAKDIILAIIGEIGTAGGTGYALEYAGEAIRALSMEGRMTVCNMSVEGGAKAGFIAPDEKAYAYLKDRPKAPKGKAWDEAMRYWETLRSDDGAHFDREIRLDAAKLPPLVTWGTSPEQVISITGRVPVPSEIADENKRRAAATSLDYMGLKGGEKITDIAIDRVFIGSCTNGRIEDLREAARVAEGKTVNAGVNAMIVPGSGLVKEQAEAEGLDKIFVEGRLRMARARLLDVPRDEPRQARARRALRLDLEPQLRGPPGLQGPHPPGVAGDGGRRRDRGPLRGRAGVALTRDATQSSPLTAASAERPAPQRRRRASVARSRPGTSVRLVCGSGRDSATGLEPGGTAVQRDHPQRHVAVGKTPRGQLRRWPAVPAARHRRGHMPGTGAALMRKGAASREAVGGLPAPARHSRWRRRQWLAADNVVTGNMALQSTASRPSSAALTVRPAARVVGCGIGDGDRGSGGRRGDDGHDGGRDHGPPRSRHRPEQAVDEIDREDGEQAGHHRHVATRYAMKGLIGESSCIKYQSSANASTRRIAGGLERQSATTRSAPARPASASVSPEPGRELIIR